MGKTYSFVFALTALSLNFAGAQQPGFPFISPLPGSTLIPCQTTIAIREGSRLILPGNSESSPIRINGSSSGPVAGRLSLSDDGRTLVIKPEQAFAPGELVSVDLLGGLLTDKSTPVGALHFSFRTRPEER